jgi:hypothetical protein
MKKYHIFCTPAVLATILTLGSALAASAQEPTPRDDAAVPADDDSWYYRAVPDRTPTPSLARQKAQARGAQRMARLEAMRWYGFSNSRPTATSIPWTTMYSPAWQMPGGRPFAWYVSTRPVIVYVQPAPIYR